jgi:hypothetical protein
LSPNSADATGGLLGSISKGASTGNRFGFLTDQTAMPIEITIANIMRINNSGLSEIKLKDNGRTGSTLGPGIVGDVESLGVG